MGRRIFVADIGSTRCERGRTPNFGWAGVDPEQPERLFGSSNIDTLAAALVTALQAGHHIALGFEAPLFIPVPSGSVDLCHGRANEKSRSFAAPAGLAVTTLMVHQAAWLLRHVRENSNPVPRFTIDPAHWPPTGLERTLFCWEAFVSEGAHGDTHVQDAATAAMAFTAHESDLRAATAITAVRPISLIGAVALWSGLSDDLRLLHQPTVVLRPTKPFEGSIEEA